MATNFGPSRSSVANFPIQIDISGFRINADLIKASTFRMARQFGDMSWPLRTSIKLVVIPTMDTNFIMGGRPQWEPLAESTALKRISKNPGQNAFAPLFDSGHMYDIVVGGKYWRVTRDKADMEMLDTVVPYAKYHQSGTRHVPQRQFAVLQQKDIERIVVIFDSWLNSITSQKDMWPYNHKEF